ncbi:MAG TPA: guanine deaminase [Casimicrobiaceae bacterium]
MAGAPAPEEPGNAGLRAFRGALLHFIGDPADAGEHAYEYFEDGLLVVDGGHVVGAGEATAALARLPAGTPVVDRTGKLIVPGFVDTHIHYPQTDMIAAYGEQLLEWLERYTYPAERRFADAAHGHEVAEFFLDELLRNGTTTALVYATVHPESAEAFFAAAQARGARMIAGKVLMDRNCPEFLRDTAESGHADSKALIARWHGKSRLSYAVTPRFAPASTERQLELAGRLLDEHPDVYLQTHVAENRNEVAWAAEVFPWSRSYLHVYDHFGLVRPRAVFAHCIHLDDADRARMGAAGAAMAFCPTSNLFLGSGLFDIDAARRHGVRVGLGTDIGAGTSFSQLRSLDEAYKVAQLAGQRLSPLSAFHLATLGGARALYLDDRIGNFLPGKEADFIVIDPAATPLLARRMKHAPALQDKLFALMMLADDRAIAETWLMGVRRHVRAEQAPAHAC